MIKIAICDDNEWIRDEMKIILGKAKITLNLEIQISDFSSGEELIENIDKNNYYDLIFLDIEMGKLSGIDVAKYIRENKNNYSTQIAFVTCKEEYVKAVFEINTLNFIEKPMKQEKIIKTIEQVLKIKDDDRRFFSYKIKRTYHNIPYSDIYYFQVDKRKTTIYTTREEIVFYSSLKEVEKKLDKNKFVRVHQSFIVNKSKVENLSNHDIQLVNCEKKIPMARERKSEVVAALFD